MCHLIMTQHINTQSYYDIVYNNDLLSFHEQHLSPIIIPQHEP